MKFTEYPYVRPDMTRLKDDFSSLLKKFDQADSGEKQLNIMDEINKVRIEFETMSQIATIKYTIDTVNEDNNKEQEFFDKNEPLYQGLISDYYVCLAKSKFKSVLEKKWGKQLFNMAELSVKAFSQEIIEDLQEENKLASEYTKLIASAKILFDGEERNLSELVPFTQSKDRDIRKKASEV